MDNHVVAAVSSWEMYQVSCGILSMIFCRNSTTCITQSESQVRCSIFKIFEISLIVCSILVIGYILKKTGQSLFKCGKRIIFGETDGEQHEGEDASMNDDGGYYPDQNPMISPRNLMVFFTTKISNPAPLNTDYHKLKTINSQSLIMEA